MRFKGTGVGADLQRKENGGLHLHKPVSVKVCADLAHDLRAARKQGAHVFVHDEIDVPQAVLQILIDKAVVLFGQREQRLGEHFDMRDVHRGLARLRFEHPAADAHDVADIVLFFKGGVRLFAHVLAGDVNLQLPFAVLHVRKRGLAHDAAGHHAPRNGDLFSLPRGKIVLDALRARRDGKRGLAIGIVPLVGKFF